MDEVMVELLWMLVYLAAAGAVITVVVVAVDELVSYMRKKGKDDGG